MREAVIVSTARTPIGKAYRGAFNDTQAQELAGHAIKHAVQRAGIEPGEVEDVVIGAALQQGSTGSNIGRQAAMRADAVVDDAAAHPVVDDAPVQASREAAQDLRAHQHRDHDHDPRPGAIEEVGL